MPQDGRRVPQTLPRHTPAGPPPHPCPCCSALESGPNFPSAPWVSSLAACLGVLFGAFTSLCPLTLDPVLLCLLLGSPWSPGPHNSPGPDGQVLLEGRPRPGSVSVPYLLMAAGHQGHLLSWGWGFLRKASSEDQRGKKNLSVLLHI